MKQEERDFYEFLMSKEKPFYIDTFRELLRRFDNEEISLSKVVEELNKTAYDWQRTQTQKEQGEAESGLWFSVVKRMPDFDGDYLCLVVRKNECGTHSQYQRVLNCRMNKFITNDESEKVYLWRKLPTLPQRKVVLL